MLTRCRCAQSGLRLLSPALRLSIPIPWSDSIPIPRSDPIPRSGPSGLAVCASTLPVTKLRIAAQFANAIVTRVRRHHPPVRALRGHFTLLTLGHCEICKATHASEYRNGEEYLDHVPTSLADRLA